MERDPVSLAQPELPWAPAEVWALRAGHTGGSAGLLRVGAPCPWGGEDRMASATDSSARSAVKPATNFKLSKLPTGVRNPKATQMRVRE